MNIEEFREYCLSLPDVTKGTPFKKFSRGKYTILGQPVLTVVFYVNSHVFCYFRPISKTKPRVRHLINVKEPHFLHFEA
jgi:hypothetical protein